MIQSKETLTISSAMSGVNEKKIIGGIAKIVNIDDDNMYPFKLVSSSRREGSSWESSDRRKEI